MTVNNRVIARDRVIAVIGKAVQAIFVGPKSALFLNDFIRSCAEYLKNNLASRDSDFSTSSDKDLIDRRNSGFKNTSIENIGDVGFLMPFLADLSPISANLRRFFANLPHVFADLTAIFANLISVWATTFLEMASTQSADVLRVICRRDRNETVGQFGFS